MNAPQADRATRQDSRRPLVMDAAAELFAAHGFHGASLRDIARAVGMLPGSIYCHFPSKSRLLLAVYQEGVERIIDRVDSAVAGCEEPWERIEAACRAHLETLLDGGAYARVVIRVLPADAADVAGELTALRDRYEARFHALVADLDLPPDRDPSRFRLLLLGALNWTQTWYRPDRASPGEIAGQFVAMLRGNA